MKTNDPCKGNHMPTQTAKQHRFSELTDDLYFLCVVFCTIALVIFVFSWETLIPVAHTGMLFLTALAFLMMRAPFNHDENDFDHPLLKNWWILVATIGVIEGLLVSVVTLFLYCSVWIWTQV